MATYKSIRYIVPVEAVEHTDSINALNDVDTNTTAPTDGQILKWNNTNSKWYPGDVEEASGTQKAIFGFGRDDNNNTNVTNLVSSSGVMSSDVTGVGTSRDYLAASSYGGDKAIFGYGGEGNLTNVTNLVSNTGVVGSDQTGVGTERGYLAAACYGEDKGIFGFGNQYNSVTNLVSNTGVVASDTTGVGSIREQLAATGYGGDKAIFGFGLLENGDNTSITNLVSNLGVVATDTTGVGSAISNPGAAGYGGDKAIFGFGGGMVNYMFTVYNKTNLVSNTGVVSSDVTGVGTARSWAAASSYGGDKALFAFGIISSYLNTVNLVSNTGVVSSDSTGAGTAREGLAAAGYSTTA